MLDILSKMFTLDGKGHLLPLLWLITAGLLLRMMPLRQEIVCGERKENWYGFSAVLLVLPLIFWAGFRINIGDTYAYRLQFRSASASLSDLFG